MQLVLATSSPYRKKLFARLGLEFVCSAPGIDETPQTREPPRALALRLAKQKAEAVAPNYPESLIIASDQVAVAGNQIFDKPGTIERAERQLMEASGNWLEVLTALVIFDPIVRSFNSDIVPFRVKFRTLSKDQIANYLQRDLPFDCAGSFKWESLGIALFERMAGDDVTALEGLPLIQLTSMLADKGIRVI